MRLRVLLPTIIRPRLWNQTQQIDKTSGTLEQRPEHAAASRRGRGTLYRLPLGVGPAKKLSMHIPTPYNVTATDFRGS